MPRIFSGHSRSASGSRSPSRSAVGETPDLRPGSEAFSGFDGVGTPPQQSDPRPRKTPRAPLSLPSTSEGTTKEMIPILSLLTAHSARTYQEGYFMLLNDINNDGRPVNNRQWLEVFASLTGPTLACWDAHALDQGADPKPIYMNITDATFKSVQTLPAGKQGLERIIVVSTTMKNRYLLQFATDKSFNEWTAALRLSQFEHTALQEAYTGALLSSRGSQLNGARALLGGTKTVREDWCNVRFGGGMPWNRCYYVLTPPNLVKDKKQKKAGLGEISFYESPKSIKKGPLATVTTAFNAYAVFPERAVLVDVSNLIKCQGMVRFSKDKESRESQIFIMPEQHPGIKGFETLIRFIIPFLDIFQLYGRPKRLNADKRDTRSLLFAMPTLPKAYYLDVVDVGMLTALPESYNWSHNQWTDKIKELLARKLASGYKGLGSIHDVVNQRSRERSESSSEKSQPVIVAKREAPKAPKLKEPGAGVNGLNVNGLSVQGRDTRALSQPRPFEKGQFLPPQPISNINSAHHERSASEGQDRNDLLQPTPYTPPPPGANGSVTSFHSAYSGANIVTTPNGSSSSFRNEHSPKHASPLRPPQINTQYAPQSGGSLDTPNSESSSMYNPTPTLTGNVYGGGSGPQAQQAQQPSQVSKQLQAPLSETKPGHYSYAEYSEYMRTYLANGIDEDGNPATGSAVTSSVPSAAAAAAVNRSPPRKAVGPRPQPGRDQPPMPSAPTNYSSTSVASSQFATGGPRRAQDSSTSVNGNPYTGKSKLDPYSQQQQQQQQPQQHTPNYSRSPQATYGTQQKQPLQPAYQQQQQSQGYSQPSRQQHQQQQGQYSQPPSQPQAGRSPYGQNPNYSSGNLQPPRGQQQQQQRSPQSPQGNPYGNGPRGNPSPNGNPYATGHGQVQQRPPPPQQQQQQQGGYLQAQPQQSQPARYSPRVPQQGFQQAPPQQQQQQSMQHHDVRQAPPMRQPPRNNTSPYGIASSSQGSYPAFPQGQSRTRVNGGRPMP